MENNNNEIEDSETFFKLIQRGDASDLKSQILLQSKSSKCSIEFKDNVGNTPLLQAALLGKSDCVKILLEIGQANYQVINVLGQNALTLASYAGCIDCIKILLTKWSYKNYTESSLLPPLCVAAMKGHLEIVNLFCQLTPSPNLIQSAHGITPLDLAKKNGHKDVIQRLSEEFARKPMDRNKKQKVKNPEARFKPY